MFFYKFFFRISKMLVRYYKKKHGRLQKKVHKKYQNLSDEEKNKKPQYAPEQYRNLSEEREKQKIST